MDHLMAENQRKNKGSQMGQATPKKICVTTGPSLLPHFKKSLSTEHVIIYFTSNFGNKMSFFISLSQN